MSYRGSDSPIRVQANALQEKIDLLEEKLLNNKQLIALKKARDALYRKAKNKEAYTREECRKLRHQYMANGITKDLITRLNKLLSKLEASK